MTQTIPDFIQAAADKIRALGFETKAYPPGPGDGGNISVKVAQFDLRFDWDRSVTHVTPFAAQWHGQKGEFLCARGFAISPAGEGFVHLSPPRGLRGQDDALFLVHCFTSALEKGEKIKGPASFSQVAKNLILDEIKSVLELPEPDPIDQAWPEEMAQAALREGWNIWECGGLGSEDWQICRVDDPDALEDGFVPPLLASDDVAVEIVAHGTQPHHEAARNFIFTFGNEEARRELQAAIDIPLPAPDAERQERERCR